MLWGSHTYHYGWDGSQQKGCKCNTCKQGPQPNEDARRSLQSYTSFNSQAKLSVFCRSAPKGAAFWLPACSITRVALLNRCEHVVLPLCLSDEHLNMLHCDTLGLMGCKPCMDQAWLENLVVGTEATGIARRYEGIYVLADKSALGTVPRC